ncbi:MAG: ATP-binding protein [Saprospiraceae bacterium]
MSSKKDLIFFRRVSIVCAVLLLGITLMNAFMVTDIQDVALPRLFIAIALLAMNYTSYHNVFVRRNCSSIFYLLLLLYISYAIHLSFLNHFPIYDVSATIIVAIALAALFKSKKHLRIYLIVVYLEFFGLFFMCEKPIVETNYLFMSLTLLIALGYFVLVGKLDAIASLTKSKAALLKSEIRFKNIFEYSPIGILLLDSNLNVMQVNPTVVKILGYSEAELKLMHRLNYIDEHDFLPTNIVLKKIKGGGNKPLVKEQRFIRKDGTKRWLRSTLEVMDDLQEGVPCIISMIEDISFEQSARMKLNEYAQKLKNHNESLEEFSYVVSHDLQEPLRMIKSYTSLIKRRYIKGLNNKEAELDIDYVLDGADRMSLLIRDMLSYSKWSAKPFTTEEVSSMAVLTDVIQNLSMSMQEKEAEITCHDMPDLATNRVLLGQIFQNLVGNGLKYSQEDRSPRLTVYGEERAYDILFTIKDNGMGFDLKEKQRIFGLFQRINPHGVNKGTGIGLAICKRIIERQGGQIWADATLGEGSTFYFTLPKRKLSTMEI